MNKTKETWKRRTRSTTINRKKLDELRERMMDHAAIEEVAIVVVTARELHDLIVIAEAALERGKR